jgi:two-component system, cell cycle sensor histidine kinase and response regulator CckA
VTLSSQLAEMSVTARALAARGPVILGLGAVFGLMAWAVPVPLLSGVALAASVGLIGTFVVMRLVARIAIGQAAQAEAALQALVDRDATPCVVTDDLGRITWSNQAARDRFGDRAGDTMVQALGDHFANPGALLYRLQNRAGHAGQAREDVVTRRGHLRLAVHRQGEGRYLWRLEEFQDRAGVGRGAEGLSLPMLVANRSGVILFSNEAMRRIAGLRPRRLDQLFAGDAPRSGEEVTVTGAEGPLRAIMAEVEGAGDRREIYLLPVTTEGPPRDLTDFEQTPVAMMRFTADGALIAANRAARDLLALPEGTGGMFHTFFDGLGRPVTDWLVDVLHDRAANRAEVLRALTVSTETFLQITLQRIVDRGRPGVLAVLNDATALKTLEAQFVQSQKMHAIGQLAGGVAHDFNNLLTAISGHCDLLLLRHGQGDPDYADLTQIAQNANRAAAVVGQLLAYSRKQTLKPQRSELPDVLSDMSHLLNRLVGEKVRLRLAHAPDLGAIRADRRQLEQVIMNLVVNARDAMAEGGVIRIATEAVTLRDDLARDKARVPAGDYAVIRVSDTGHGIPPDRISKIWEPFFTTKRPGEGTGLGLSTVYGIVKQSGGFIFVDSAEGEGTDFTIYFPINEATDAQLPDIAPPEPAEASRAGDGVVLVVEDEAPVRAFAVRALQLRGYRVLEAATAEDALEQLENPDLRVDVFVTDVVMPGMDGPTWVSLALETRPETRVIFVSGYAEDVLSENQARVPNSIFLPKPYSLTDLTRTVAAQLH